MLVSLYSPPPPQAKSPWLPGLHFFHGRAARCQGLGVGGIWLPLCPQGPAARLFPHNTDAGRRASPRALGLLAREWRAMSKASCSLDHLLGLPGSTSTSLLALNQSWVQQQQERGELLVMERIRVV